jgi:hypothetical protein
VSIGVIRGGCYLILLYFSTSIMRKLILLFLCLTAGIAIDLVLVSCNPCGRGSGGGGAIKVSKVDLLGLDTAWVAKDVDTLKYRGDTLNFVVDFVFVGVTRIEAPAFVQSAYACQPPELVLLNERDSMVLIAVTDFDNEHPAGSSLNDIAEFGGEYWEKHIPYTFDPALQVNQLGRFVSFSNNDGFHGRLLKAPLTKTARIRIELRGTETFQDEIPISK